MQNKPVSADDDLKMALYTKLGWGLVALGIIVVAIGVPKLYANGVTLDNLSKFGDFLSGSSAAIWSLAGLMFIYVAFLGQKAQMQQQQREIEDQNRHFVAQQISIDRQNFEASLFQFLGVLNNIIKDLRWDDFGTLREGRDAFEGLYGRFHRNYMGHLDGKTADLLDSVEFASDAYEIFYVPVQADLGHYFRTLYHIIKFIDESGMENKRRYTSMVRAQLSAYELALLHYNGISRLGEKFKDLIERYGLLKNFDRKALLIHNTHEDFYRGSAYT